MTTLTKIGTTSPIYIPREDSSGPIVPGTCYLFVKIVAAQAVFPANLLDTAADLIITSQVSIDHREFKSPPIFNIQKKRQLKKNAIQQLGLSSNLIDVIPATMAQLAISIDFVLDKGNVLSPFKSLIDENLFTKAASFLPGPALVATTVSEFSKKIFSTFLDKDKRETILQLDADINIGSGTVLDGYYAVVSSHNKNIPLPEHNDNFDFKDGQLVIKNQPVTDLNYIVLDIHRVTSRSRSHDGSPWEQKLLEAENLSLITGLNPLASTADKKAAWERCMDFLREAQLLLSYDLAYIAPEAASIIKLAFETCRLRIFSTPTTKGVQYRGFSDIIELFDQGKQLLHIPLEEDLDNTNADYLAKREFDLATMRDAGFL
jgi:hypothetical protein